MIELIDNIDDTLPSQIGPETTVDEQKDDDDSLYDYMININL